MYLRHKSYKFISVHSATIRRNDGLSCRLSAVCVFIIYWFGSVRATCALKSFITRLHIIYNLTHNNFFLIVCVDYNGILCVSNCAWHLPLVLIYHKSISYENYYLCGTFSIHFIFISNLCRSQVVYKHKIDSR